MLTTTSPTGDVLPHHLNLFEPTGKQYRMMQRIMFDRTTSLSMNSYNGNEWTTASSFLRLYNEPPTHLE